MYDKLVIKVNANALDTKIPKTSGLALKHSIISTSRVLKRTLGMLTKRYVTGQKD